MKKLILLCSTILCCLTSYSQTLSLSPSSTTVNSGTPITITAVGETSSKYFFALTFNHDYTVASPNQSYTSLVNGEVSGNTTFYNTASSTATSFPFTPTNTSPVPVTVTYRFRMTPYNGSSMPPVDLPITITVNPFYRSAAYSKSFTRNDCGAGYQGTSVTTSAFYGQFTSAVNQATADQAAVNYVNANGQARANSQGTCNLIYNSIAYTSSFTRNNCDSHSEAGPAVSYTLPAGAKTSIISQADADAQALVVFNTNGQNNANATGTCIIRNKTFITYSNQAFTGSRISRVRIYNSSNTLVYDFNETQLLAGPEIDLGIYKFVVTTVGPISNVVAPNTGWGSFDITLSNTGTGYYAVENTGGTSYTVNSVDTSNSHELVLGIYKTF